MATFTVNGAPVSREVFYRHPGFGVFTFAIAYSGALAIAIQRRHASARLLMLAVWPLCLVAYFLVSAPNVDPVARAMGAVPAVAMSAIAAWYLFVKANVTAYFDERSALTTRAHENQ